MKPYKQLGFPPQRMNFSLFEPLDVLIDEFQVVCPEQFSHDEIHFHVREATADLSSTAPLGERYRYPRGEGRIERRLTFFQGRRLGLSRMADWLLLHRLSPRRSIVRA